MKISLDISDRISSCNNCNAQNYTSAFDRNPKIVKNIYEIRIGCMVNCLCSNCLAELIGKATVALAMEKTED